MSESSNPPFGKLRSLFFPVYRHELKKFLPMMAMLFFICFNYSILRTMKDAVVVTTSGAEVIPFIKVWVMLPTAVLLTFVFTKLTNRFSQEQVFYIMVSGFLISYAFFAFVLYPCRDLLHLHDTADYMETILPIGCKGLIDMLRHWSFTLFYVMCELWSSIVVTVLFWGFANEITKISEARRFYGLFSIGLNLAAITAGETSVFFGQRDFVSDILPFGGSGDAWEQTMKLLVLAVIIAGLLTMAIFHWMNRYVLNDDNFDEMHSAHPIPKKVKNKLSVKDSFSYLSNSKYLLCIAVIVVAYNLVINLVEIVWKDQLRRVYPSPNDYNNYMAHLTISIGVLSTIAALFMGKIYNRFGWTKTALATPVVMLVTCLGFFSFLFFQDHLEDTVLTLTGTTPLVIAVFFGFSQNCLSKAAKYSVYDMTKEMSFIPLSHECKLKGKAAIDGVGSRLGKSGGSLIHQSLLLFFSTITASAPYVAVIILIVILMWIGATRALGRQFNDLIASHQDDQEIASSPVAQTPAIAISTAVPPPQSDAHPVTA